MIAAMPMESTNESPPAASPPAKEASQPATRLSICAYLVRYTDMLFATSDHPSVSFSPTSGKFASRGGGGGTVRLWFCRSETSVYIEDPSDVTTINIGASIPTTPTTPMIDA